MFSIIVPTYNESANIRDLIDKVLPVLRQLTEPAELLIVDDDSPDHTARIAREHAAELQAGDYVRVLVRTQDRGLAKAVLAGFDAAKGDVLAVMDADLSHPPQLLPKLLNAVRNGAEFALASRYVPGGGVVNWPWRRRLISKFACWIAQPLVRVRDITSGYFAFLRSCLPANGLRPRGYKIGLEILARGAIQHVQEVPFEFKDRTAGRSKMSSTVMLAYLMQLLSLYRVRFPLAVGYLQFALVGLLGMAVDAAVFGFAYWYLGLNALGAAGGGLIAQSLSFLAAVSLNFKINAAWTFKERSANARWRRFFLVSLAGYAIRSLVFAALILALARFPENAFWWGLPLEQWVLFAAITIASIWNYLASRAFVFYSHDESRLGLPEIREQAAGGWLSFLLLLSLAAGLFFGASTFLAADEAYYWQWSRHLAWGYFDHPPMIAYLVAAGTRLLGHSELGVRLLPSLLMVASLWLVHRLAYEFGGRRQAGLWAALLLFVTPLFAVGGGLATPDAPLVFFWALGLWLTIQALALNRLRWWLLLGLVLGLGVISKYSFIILPLCLLMVCLSDSRSRRLFTEPGVYAAIMTTVLVALPMLLWNFHRDMASIGFQLGHGLQSDETQIAWQNFAVFWAGQIGVVTPLLFGLCVWALSASRRGCNGAPTPSSLPQPLLWRLLAIPAVATALLFAFASLAAKSEPNWAAPAYLSLFALAGVALDRHWAVMRRFWRVLIVAALLIPALLAFYLRVEFSFPLLAYESSFFDKLRDRSALVAWVQDLRATQAQGVDAALIAANYKDASMLAFYLPDQPAVDAVLETGSGSAYHEWPANLCRHEFAWYFAGREKTADLERLFASYQRVASFTETRKQVPMKTMQAFFGRLLPLNQLEFCAHFDNDND